MTPVLLTALAALSLTRVDQISPADAGTGISQIDPRNVVAPAADAASEPETSILVQSSDGERASVTQTGPGDRSEIIQTGGGDVAEVLQRRAGASSVIVQTGSGNTAFVRQ